ncbi:MAG: Tad domain-containing protein [Candidatus Dormiibacterota bacterium]
MNHIRRRKQHGQASVIVGAMIVGLTILGAMVFDVGLAMSDRRNLQAYADSAALAGARSYNRQQGTNHAHWTAMQYLGASLAFGLPVGGCSSPSSCPSGTYSVVGYQVTMSDTFRVGGILNYPTVLDVVVTHRQPSIFARMIGFSQLTTAASARATRPGPQFNGAAYAVAAVSGDAMIDGGGAAFQTVGGPVYAYGSFGANNGPHSTGVPSVRTNFDGTTCPGGPSNLLDNGGGTNSLNFHTTDGNTLTNNVGVPPDFNYDDASPIAAQPAPQYFSAAAAKDLSGNWKPGIYNGFAPSGGTMNGGVYKIINSANLSLGNITNAIHTASGTSDPTGAVAIVIDSSDTGSLDISQAVLNGLDDLNTPGYTGLRDPMGTHNFVIFGGHGAAGYTGGITIGPHATTDMSGIIYVPDSAYVSDGNSSPQFTGSLVVSSMTVHGGGNGAQVFHWVCGLNAVAGQPYQGGLVR